MARRLDKPETYGPSSYEIGGTEDPDWAENDPGANAPGENEPGENDPGT